MVASSQITSDIVEPITFQITSTMVIADPFPFVIAHDVLSDQFSELINNDFPNLTGAGYLPYEAADCGTHINQVVSALTDPTFSDALGNLLGVPNMAQYPTYVSISKRLNRRHGRIHTDGSSKIATALLYLNDRWSNTSEGCLRFLSEPDNFDSYIVPEVPPIFGTLVAFRRTDCSYHGHLPINGERRVIQVAWLKSVEDKFRKAKRGRFAQRLKSALKL